LCCVALWSVGCAGAAVQPAKQLETGEVLLSGSILIGSPGLAGLQGQTTVGFGIGDVSLNGTFGMMPKVGASLRLYATGWAMIGAQLEYHGADANEPDRVLRFCDGHGTDYTRSAYGRVMTNATKLGGFYAGFLYGRAWRSGVATVEEIKSTYTLDCEEMFYADDFNSLGSGGRLILGFHLIAQKNEPLEIGFESGELQIELMIPLWTHVNTQGVVGWDGTQDELVDEMWGIGNGFSAINYNTFLTLTYHYSL
jgi:hypothetical protein